MDSSQWPSLSDPDPEIEAALKEHPLPSHEFDDPAQIPLIRAGGHAGMVKSFYSRLDFQGVAQSSIDIPLRDGSSSTSLLFKPSTPPTAGSPLAILYHGGGFILGSAEMEALSAVPLVKDFGCVVVSVEYRMAPEHPFPTPVNDCWDALKWCAANASTLDADPSKGLLIGGSSAGGNLAAVLQHLARDEQLNPPVTGTWLAYPATISQDAIPPEFKAEHTSRAQNGNAPGLSVKMSDFIRRCYKPDPKSGLYNPLIWPSGHAGLSRTYVHVCGLDLLRDDGLLYERELRKMGVETKLEVYPGCPHGLDIMMPQVRPARKFEEDRVEAFRWLLRQD